MEARAGGAVPRFVGFLYTLAKLVPVERFTGRHCNGAECLSSANSSVKGTRALRPRGLWRQAASDWSAFGEINSPSAARKPVESCPLGAVP